MSHLVSIIVPFIMELSLFDRRFAESVKTCVMSLIGILNVLMVFTRLGWTNVHQLFEVVLKNLNNLYLDIDRFERSGRPQPLIPIGASNGFNPAAPSETALNLTTTTSVASSQATARTVDSDGYEVLRNIPVTRASSRHVTFKFD